MSSANASATAPPTIDDVRRAADRIAGEAVLTPLLSSPLLDALVGGRVLLKCENLQRTGSFKFRGAYNAVSALSNDERAGGVVAVSSGNHAQGVAEAARLHGIAATIVMPADAPDVKRRGTERSGGRVIAYDRRGEDRNAVAASYIADHGGVLIHPYNDPRVIAGQGTIGLEIADECARLGVYPDTVVVPCSGGGLSSGVGLAVRDRFARAAIVLAEPVGFDEYARSLVAGEVMTNTGTSNSIMDALLAISPGPMGFAINQANRAAGVTVSDAEALAAVAFAFNELKLVVEPGGAAALAAVRAGRIDARDRTTVVVLSGGNIDQAMLDRALQAAG